MPHLIHSVPKYRLHRAGGQAVVTINGKDHYLGLWKSVASKLEYDRLVGVWQINGRSLNRLENTPQHFTVNEVLLKYLQHALTYYVKNGRCTSEVNSIRSALRPLAKIYGREPAKDFGPLSLKNVREEMVRFGWCRSAINKHLGRLKRVFRWAAENELVPGETYHALQAVSGLRRGRSAAVESAPVRPVPEEHVNAVLPFVSPQVAAMIQLQLATGMRPGEACSIRGCELDTSGTNWIYRPSSHKTEHHGLERLIYLGPRAQQIVRPFLKPDLTQHLFSPAAAEQSRNHQRRKLRKSPMTPSQSLRRPRAHRQRPPKNSYTVDSYRRAIARACEFAFEMPEHLKEPLTKAAKQAEADLPEEDRKRCQRGRKEARQSWREQHVWHPNQLRHTAATKLRKEFGIEAARVVLGHRSASVTEVYAELDQMKAAEVMGRVG